MITSLGIVLLVVPYILVLNSSHKLRTILSVFTYTSLAYICIAVLTQTFHVFTYGVISVLHALVALYSVYYFYKNTQGQAHVNSRDHVHGHGQNYKHELKYVFNSLTVWHSGWKIIKDNVFPIFFFALSVFLLYSIHFNFSGYADSAVGLRTLAHNSYTYPLYSDEWVGASFVDYSIRTGQLPFANPLDRDTPFPNFLFVTHSFVAEMVLLLGLTAVTSYIYFAMLNALAIVVAVYCMLRSLKIRKTIASVTAFSVLLLTNSGNLPGIWFLLPYAFSLVFLLYSIVGMEIGIKRLAIVNSSLALFIYPPMIVFIAPIWLAYLGNKVNMYKKIYIIVAACVSIVVISLILFVSYGFQVGQTFAKAFSYLVRQPLDVGVVYYWPWNVMPVFSLLFVCIGVCIVYKNNKKLLLYPIYVGIFYWILYTFNQTVYIIETARVVVVISVLLTIAAGFGYEAAYMFAKEKTKKTFLDISDDFTHVSLKVLVLIFFTFWALNISKFGLWHKMPLVYGMKIIGQNGQIQYQQQKLTPAPPVTRYLNPDDLRLFSGFEGKKFIAPSWKGLVVGVATHNYPLDSKSSTITNNFLQYDVFAAANCDKKNEYIKKYNIDLAYGTSTTCTGFTEIGKSSEGLYLYSLNKTINKASSSISVDKKSLKSS